MRIMTTVLVALLVFGAADPALAQDPTSLEDIQELARMGRTEEARTALLAWWETDRDEASRRDLQRALWLRGILTVDPEQAVMDFRRLIVEYPGGPFSDQALFRMAQAAFEAGYPREADAYVAALVRDYPSSPVREEAVAWLAAASERGSMVQAPPDSVPPADSLAEAAPAAERPPEPEANVPVEVLAPPPAQPDSTPAEALPRRFGVQLGAFSSDDRARALYRRAQDAGLEPRLVRLPSTRLLHVRIGTYDSATEAGDLLRRVTAMGFVGALVRDVNDEERIQR